MQKWRIKKVEKNHTDVVAKEMGRGRGSNLRNIFVLDPPIQ
jgi:hypothetical protein